MATRSLPARIATSAAAALMFGVAATLLLGVASFIAVQSASLLRMALILPSHEVRFAWVGALVAVIAFTVLVRARRSYFLAAVVTLALAFGCDWAVQLPAVSSRVLPPVHGK